MKQQKRSQFLISDLYCKIFLRKYEKIRDHDLNGNYINVCSFIHSFVRSFSHSFEHSYLLSFSAIRADDVTRRDTSLPLCRLIFILPIKCLSYERQSQKRNRQSESTYSRTDRGSDPHRIHASLHGYRGPISCIRLFSSPGEYRILSILIYL